MTNHNTKSCQGRAELRCAEQRLREALPCSFFQEVSLSSDLSSHFVAEACCRFFSRSPTVKESLKKTPLIPKDIIFFKILLLLQGPQQQDSMQRLYVFRRIVLDSLCTFIAFSNPYILKILLKILLALP